MSKLKIQKDEGCLVRLTLNNGKRHWVGQAPNGQFHAMTVKHFASIFPNGDYAWRCFGKMMNAQHRKWMRKEGIFYNKAELIYCYCPERADE